MGKRTTIIYLSNKEHHVTFLPEAQLTAAISYFSTPASPIKFKKLEVTTWTQGCDRYKYFGSPNQIQNQIRFVLFGSDRYKDTIPLWENDKLCISEQDIDPNWVGSFGPARYMWRYIKTLLERATGRQENGHEVDLSWGKNAMLVNLVIGNHGMFEMVFWWNRTILVL